MTEYDDEETLNRISESGCSHTPGPTSRRPPAVLPPSLLNIRSAFAMWSTP
jgi:hypothetical protein